MSAATLLFKQPRGKIDVVELDATVSEQHQGMADVTEHPVETGSDITDHIRRKPNRITLEGVVTNSPLSASQAATTVVLADGTSFKTTNPSSNSAVGAFTGAGRAEIALQRLDDLLGGGRLFTVVTGIRVYENMAMVSLDVPRDQKTGEALRFTAAFVQVRFVKNKTTLVQVARMPSGNGKNNLGKQATKKTDKATTNKSWLKQLDDSALGGFLGEIGES